MFILREGDKSSACDATAKTSDRRTLIRLPDQTSLEDQEPVLAGDVSGVPARRAR